jgi:hypothetical protein
MPGWYFFWVWVFVVGNDNDDGFGLPLSFLVIWLVNNSCKLVLPLIQLAGWQSPNCICSPIFLPWAKLNNSVFLRTDGQLLYSTELYNFAQCATGLVYLNLPSSLSLISKCLYSRFCFYLTVHICTPPMSSCVE